MTRHGWLEDPRTDTDWLVYGDWLEDQGRMEEAQDVRDCVENPSVQKWEYEWRFGGFGGVVGGGVVVGGIGGGVVGVGGGGGGRVGVGI